MSSSHTYISNREWEEMQERVAQTDSYVIRSQQETNRLYALAEQRRQEARRISDAARQNIETACAALTESYRQALSQASSRLTSDVDSSGRSFRGQLDGLRRQYAQANARLTGMNEDIAAIGRQYSDAMNAYWSQIADQKARAEAYIQELQRMIAQIQSLEPQLHTPAEFASLQTRLDFARSNIGAGVYQAALAGAQISINDAGCLLTRLTILQEQYISRTEELRESLQALGGRIDALASPEGSIEFTLGGSECAVPYSIRDWSDGEFARIQAEYSRNYSELEHLPSSQIDSMQRRIGDLDRALTLCDTRARREFAGSLSVQDMAEQLQCRFENSGWQQVSADWTDGDERKPYSMIYRDGAGNDVSIVISPGEDPENPMLSFDVFSEQEEQADATRQELVAMLPELGMEAGPIELRNDCHQNPTPENFLDRTVQEAQQRRAQRRQAVQ